MSTKFIKLAIGDTFDFVSGTNDSFFHPCRKVGSRTYIANGGLNGETELYQVGNRFVSVYHVNQVDAPSEK